MKLLELSLKNINSLYGKWSINFKHPDYQQNGLFLLSGPTGAGKSSILDAISLALYGQTARIKSISTANNEVMSRQCSDCYAEVLFETNEGCYRCHWEQKRAHNKADGKLQQATHEISDAKSKTILASKLKETRGIIEEKTGMDFDRFTRTMLLAQGAFDSFLKANDDEKSAILEQITGTDIYTTISTKCFERQRKEQQELNTLQASIQGIEILSEASIIELKEQEVQAQQRKNAYAQQLSLTRDALNWRNKLKEQSEKIEILAQKEQLAKEAQQNFAPKQAQLELALKAAKVETAYQNAKLLEQQEHQRIAKLNKLLAKLPQLAQNKQDKQEEYLTSKSQHTKNRQALEDSQELFKQVRQLDTQINSAKKQFTVERKELAMSQSQLSEQQTENSKLEGTQQKLYNKRNSLLAYQQEHAAEEWLLENLAGIEALFPQLQSLDDALEQLELSIEKQKTELQSATKEQAAAIQSSAAAQQKLTQAQETTRNAQTALALLLKGKSIADYQDKKEHLSTEYHLRLHIASLEEQRQQLQDGHACPLCGATEHPYARGNTPQIDKLEQDIEALTRFIKQAQTQERSIQNLLNASNTAEQQLTHAQTAQQLSQSKVKNGKERLTTSQAEQAEKKTQRDALHASICQQLAPLKKVESELTLAKLRQARANWNTKLEEIKKNDDAIRLKQQDLTRINAHIESLISQIEQKKASVNTHQQRIDNQIHTRRELFADKKVDAEESKLKTAISLAQADEESKEKRQQDAQHDLTQCETHISALKEQQNQNKDALKASIEQLQCKLAEENFNTEEEYIAASLPEKQRDELFKQSQQLRETLSQLSSTLANRQLEHQQEQEKQLSVKNAEELVEQEKSEQEQFTEAQKEELGIANSLSNNQKNEERIAEKKGIIEQQQKKFDRWDRLNELIGSKDGKKFRNYAQGLSFEIMVNYANEQLQRMNERYLLIRHPKHPLQLEVLDKYLEDEARTTDNLSGGERFLVSLSLALGLSRMSSKNVQVDSLFLDEGFGTLDEESLSQTLNMLGQLQESGKLIGIISHVAELKERIPTQITINNLNGRSSIAGPGVSQ